MTVAPNATEQSVLTRMISGMTSFSVQTDGHTAAGTVPDFHRIPFSIPSLNLERITIIRYKDMIYFLRQHILKK